MEIASGVVLCWLFVVFFSSLPKQPSYVFWSPVNHSSSSGKRGEEYMTQARKNAGRSGALAEEARNEPWAGAAPSKLSPGSRGAGTAGTWAGTARGQRGDSSGTAWGRLRDGPRRQRHAETQPGTAGSRQPAGFQQVRLLPRSQKHPRSLSRRETSRENGSVMGLAGTGERRGSQITSVPMGGTGVSPIGAGEPAGSCLGAGGGMGRISAQPGSLHTCLPWDRAGLGASGLL